MSGPGTNLAEALLHHKILRTFQISHKDKTLVVGWLRLSPAGSIYLLMDRDERHFYVAGQSLGMDKWIFDEVRDKATEVVIIYRGRSGITVYRASMATWISRKFPVDGFPDFDSQWQLKVRDMEIWESDSELKTKPPIRQGTLM